MSELKRFSCYAEGLTVHFELDEAGDWVSAKEALAKIEDWKQGSKAEADAGDEARHELAALREELAQWKHMVGAVGAVIPLSETLASMTTKQTMVDYFKGLHSERDGLRKSLTAAEQRNAELIEAAYKEGFSDGYSRGDSRERLKFVDAQQIDWGESDAKSALKPTESGASE